MQEPKSSEMASLAGRIRSGNRAAEEELVLRFRDRVLTMALVRTRDRETARDLTQETMLVVLSAIREDRLHDPSRLAGFICGTARNLISNWIRTRKRQEDPLDGDPPSFDSNPEDDFENAERARLAKEAIDRLKPEERKILLFTLVDGLAPSEVAGRLGLTQQAVRQRKSRALKRAREELERLSRS